MLRHILSHRVLFLSSAWLGLSLAHADTGRTPGQFAVSSSGAATYSIPLWVPPGPRGMQPHLALVYSSNGSPNGILGRGWSLAGISSITRCDKTSFEDAAAAPVTLTINDAFCLDGRRLRADTLANYGLAGSTYHTEFDDFSIITANGTVGAGPASFTVQTRDGVTYEYGVGGNSQVPSTGSTVLTWMLDKVTDPSSNTLIITYLAASSSLSGTTVPDTIQWTPSGHLSSAYNYKVQFDYGANVPQSSINGYVAGTALTNSELLTDIKVLSSATVVRQYNLTYGVSPVTLGKRLTQMQECADSAGAHCLSPTTITYQGAVAGGGVATTPSSELGSFAQALHPHHDFDGDGYSDVAYISSSTSTWWVGFGSAGGFTRLTNTNIPASVRVLFGDLQGTGKDGILASNAANTAFTYYMFNGTIISSQAVTSISTAGSVAIGLADVNGDGLPDLVVTYATSNGATYTNTGFVLPNTSTASAVRFANNTGTAFTQSGILATGAPALPPTLVTPDTQYGPLRSFDFNGDGLQDLAYMQTVCAAMIPNPGGGGSCVSWNTTPYELIAQPNGTFNAMALPSIPSVTGVPQAVYFANWNNDGCTDIIYFDTVHVSGCNGSPAATVASAGGIVGTMDWDGDGRTDLLLAGSGVLKVQLSTGTGVGTATATSVPYPSATCTVVTLDADGDGLDDVGSFCSAGLPYYKHVEPGSPPDIVASITDGFGNKVMPSYTTLTRAGTPIYTKGTGGLHCDPTNPLWCYADYIGPLNVVSSYIASDASGDPSQTYTEYLQYTGASVNTRGFGFIGFDSVQRFDPRTRLSEVDHYDRLFPYLGMLTESDTYQSTAATPGQPDPTKPVRQVVSTPATTTSGVTNSNWFFPYAGEVVDTRYELDTSLVSITDSTYTYVAGNATDVSTIVTDKDTASANAGQVWKTHTVTTYQAAANGCSILRTHVAVTNSLTGQPDLTRTLEITPDTAHCRETDRITASGTAFQVTEHDDFDPFGNASQVTTTGVGMTPRIRSTDWGTTGQFPKSQTNELNQQTQYDYDFDRGVRTKLTDPNLIVTSWLDDAFGRITKETRPDTTVTTTTFSDCSTPCVNAAARVTVVQTVLNGDNSTQTDRTTYLDHLNRPIITSGRLLSGAYDRNEVKRDSLGRIAEKDAPCLWSSCAVYATTLTYDALSRLTKTVQPHNEVDSATLLTTSIVTHGRTQTVKDPQGMNRTTVSTVFGSVSQIVDHDNYGQNFTYDAFGSLVSVVDSGSHPLFGATYDYGLSAFQHTVSDADMGARTNTYDALGELLSYQDANGTASGQTIQMTYDALSRPLTRSEPANGAAPGLNTIWSWGQTPANHDIGRLAGVSANLHYTETYQYDAVGRLASKTFGIPSDTGYEYDFSYGVTGALDTLTYPPTNAVPRLKLQYAYQNGFLQKVSDFNAPTTVYWTANAANVRGAVTQETLGNGVVTNRTFDAVTGWMSSTTSGKGDTHLQNNSYLYDEVGNVIQRENINAVLTESFHYDDVYRLHDSQLNAVTNLALSYDATGNITQRTDVANNTLWTYDAVRKHAVQQIGSQVYAYDGNGNVTTGLGYTVQWTSYNHPSVINGSTGETVAFSYNQDHVRWQAVYTGSGGTETTNYIGDRLEEVFVAGGQEYRHFIFAGSTKVAILDVATIGATTTATLRYLREDHQGGIESVLNSDGSSYVKESFTAFGARRNTCTWSGPPTNGALTKINAVSRRGYTWQIALGAMGLNDMNGRVQDAVTGRFISPDPYVSNPTFTQSWNRYSYVMNNPLSYIDPSGFDATCVAAASLFTSMGITYRIADEYSGEGDVVVVGSPVLGGIMACFGNPGMGGPGTGGPGGAGTPGSPGGAPPTAPPPPPPKKANGPTKGDKKCPGGQLATVARDAINYGKQIRQIGGEIAQMGGAFYGGGAIVSALGGPEIGVPAMALGSRLAGVGTGVASGGAAVQIAGEGVLAIMGDERALRDVAAVTLQVGVEAVLDKAADGLMTTPAPDPLDPLEDKISGEDKCQANSASAQDSSS